ncbi:MAG: septum formation initiator family protein [bacterium]|nr:septum formation initiator family protein [bacterium]
MAKGKKKSRARLCLFVPGCCLIVAVIFTMVGNYWIQIVNKYQEKNTLKQEMLSLREEEAELKVDVEKLEDPEYVARYAREKYMYSKDGEIIIRLPEEDE